MVSNGLTKDGDIYRWLNSFKELRTFVEDLLSINGKWSLPSGDVKLFTSEGEGKFIIEWNGPWSKRITIQNDSEDKYLELKFESLANQSQDKIIASHEDGNISLSLSESKVYSCIIISFVAQMESLKMDNLALESRFNGEMVSQIAFLRSNQNDLESCINWKTGRSYS